MIRLIPTAESEAELDLLFDSIDRALNPTNQDLALVARQIRLGFAANFGRESNAGEAWPQLAPRTVLERIQQGYSGEHPILRRTHDYADSWGAPAHPDHVSEIRRQAGRVDVQEGSQHPLAEYHEEGTVLMPARPVSNMPVDAVEAIRQEIESMFDMLFLTDQ